MKYILPFFQKITANIAFGTIFEEVNFYLVETYFRKHAIIIYVYNYLIISLIIYLSI